MRRRPAPPAALPPIPPLTPRRAARRTKQKQTFCRNKFNVTGLCNRSSCPLANSRYATIQEREGAQRPPPAPPAPPPLHLPALTARPLAPAGKCFLFIKTIERAHSPKNLWEKIELSANYSSALAAIDEHLQYFPKFQIHKCKQRLTKITQYLIRMRKLKLKVKPKLVGIKKKVERREKRREAKAAVAAKFEKAIEKELLERLKQGTYGDIYNFPMQEYEQALDDEEVEEEQEEEEELADDAEMLAAPQFVEDDTVEDFDDMEDFGDLAGASFSEDSEGSGEEGSGSESDEESAEEGGAAAAAAARPARPKGAEGGKKKAKRPAQRRRGNVEVEYEEETEPQREAIPFVDF